jgi:formyltetrahydrofolate hydrolase
LSGVVPLLDELQLKDWEAVAPWLEDRILVHENRTVVF